MEWAGNASSVACTDSPVLSSYIDLVIEGNFRHLVFTIAQSEFAVGPAIQFLRIATASLFASFPLEDRVRVGKPFWVRCAR